ncbi:MAG TPA: hypothetical protein VK843_17140 [Planctomycetota bacterium]|nr:hypothetical protein [Planctomycetota bacterium]
MFQTSILGASALVLTLAVALASSPQEKQQAPEAKPAQLEYPTFKPFVQARMFKFLVGDPTKLDFKAKLDELLVMAEIQKQAKEAGEKYAEPKEGPNALLTSELDSDLRAAMPLIPAAMIKLEPLWKTDAWSAEQLAGAKDAAAFLAKMPDGPKLAFVEGKPAENHEELAKLVRWFRSAVAKPEMYAAMIATVDDGPYVGLAYEAKEPLEAIQTQKLGKDIELRLCKVDRPKEPFVLQVVSKDKLLWSRVVSGGPDESVVEVQLRSKPGQLDEYGWKVFLSVKWSQGSESAYLYLDPEGRMLFYFMTW